MLALLQDVAAEVINPRFRALAAGEIHEKKPGDLVTDADREAEVLITAALVGAYPDCVVLGEEAHSVDPALMERYAAADHAFTVDPVDGTKNFVNGSRDHAVMASETRGGEVVRAWIWQPQHDLGYVAERGGGTWRRSADGSSRLEIVPPSETADLRGRTSLTIAHRLATVRSADVIFVLHDGVICERGTHEELLARRELYAHLYRIQFHDSDPARGSIAS